MTTIKTNCPVCAEVELKSDDVTLFVRRLSIESGSHYDFICPKCKDHISKPADKEQVGLLDGVVTVREIPEEYFEARSIYPLTYDDLLDFMGQIKGSSRLVNIIQQESDQVDRVE